MVESPKKGAPKEGKWDAKLKRGSIPERHTDPRGPQKEENRFGNG